MKADSNGNFHRCDGGGLRVFPHDSIWLWVIKPPSVVAGFTRRDDDMGSILLTASTSLRRVRAKAPGHPLF